MALTEQQIKSIKSQILPQIEKFPDPTQRQAAKEQIEAMDAEQLEQFLIQNKLIKQPGQEGQESTASTATTAEPEGCVFCNIAEGKTQSYKIDENKTAIAILDINPMTRGQALIVPKKHATIEKLSSSVLSLAKKIAKRLKSKLKPRPEEVRIETNSIQGHALVSIIPFYKDEKPEKKQAKPEELLALQEKLKTKERAKRKKKSKVPAKISDLPLAPVRIP